MHILYHKDFKKDYKKAPKKVREQFKERRTLFEQDRAHPLLEDHPLKQNWQGTRSFNINCDWRVVYRLLAEGVVEIVAMGTHHQLYGK
ncbi:MAG: hypothetical protein COV07_02325 [Candidatus Vogelbacteria bacterium CG10_big_fil_rev_8_21_14_0_10_45_14]|uniref:Type II toxin-antitoxin system mRNA interferase toxin, RelE/StbE family n=1 Tax=Candidatus Vogelbacteria bacterium CG10_big_fil_rev_8_21_14_0_10_45_14 TaxID=1975042 RepID=A0A2H0RLA6_9BACT|nr:MAG: hypothetical protein COV07_02325 [Candidatus Vogelbacteria bacterium CG10_big_fil_rev_8_21_14_0_10_45_14]